MKLPSNLVALYFCFLILKSTFSLAQANLHPGGVILLSGDTLMGKVNFTGDRAVSKGVAFKKRGAETKFYYPDSLAGFFFEAGKSFVSKTNSVFPNGESFFLEYLVKGELNLYSLRNDTGKRFFVEKLGEDLVEIPYNEYIVHYEDVSYLRKSNHHKGLLSVYLSDAPNLQASIYKMDEPNDDNLIGLAEQYHKQICGNDPCVIFSKKVPLVKIEVELLSGLINYSSSSGLDEIKIDRLYVGGNLYFWMPRNNTNMYFKTGFHQINSYAASNNRKYLHHKIPLIFEYRFRFGDLYPTVGYGYTWERIDKVGLSIPTLNIGAKYQILKGVALSINYSYESLNKYEWAFFLPGMQVVSHSIATGLMVKL